MELSLYFVVVLILLATAGLNLLVGVSNDAVNFLGNAVGANAASRRTILLVASIGVFIGVFFASGMMDVARKGMFNPTLFTFPDVMAIFIGVMLMDIILLDIFNTFGIPTSTTVSLVFELLGASVSVALVKVMSSGAGIEALGSYINTQKAISVILAIIMSIIFAFSLGAFNQFVARFIFTFDYKKRLSRYGGIWAGFCFSFLIYFILIKGAKGVSFISPEQKLWLKSNALTFLAGSFIVTATISQILIWMKVNIIKVLVLFGTMALALAFAANDLVNFIGVPVAGFEAFMAAQKMASPMTDLMGSIDIGHGHEIYFLLASGFIMVVSLWTSKKAKNVTDTSIKLGNQEEIVESFESTRLSRVVVRVALRIIDYVRLLIPVKIRSKVDWRMNPSYFKNDDAAASFDGIRASVSLMSAAALIALGTSLKLPLSTTFVTFMAGMGASLSDRAWSRETAVYRVTGVLTVVGCWFLTAVSAFTLAFIAAFIVIKFQFIGIAFLIVCAVFSYIKGRKLHKKKSEFKERSEMFDLKRLENLDKAKEAISFQLENYFSELQTSFTQTFEGLFKENNSILYQERLRTKMIQQWTNMITANLFKALRLMQKKNEDLVARNNYYELARRLQKLATAHRDIVVRSYLHVSNHHKGMLGDQKNEIEKVQELLTKSLNQTQSAFQDISHTLLGAEVENIDNVAKELAANLNEKQIFRIGSDQSKTRLSILYYSIMSDILVVTRQNYKIVQILSEMLR